MSRYPAGQSVICITMRGISDRSAEPDQASVVHPFFGFTMFVFWALISGGCAMIATQTAGFVVD
jgi:hypothetical protein